MPAPSQPRLTTALRQWFAEQSARAGFFPALQKAVASFWEFLLDSLPSRRRQRYGDVDYDWDHRVDTTGATIGWRDRLLGLFHSPYQPTEPALFREMLAHLDIDFPRFTFIDIGSGKGRALLMASDYPFRRILGVELLPELHRIAQENIAKYQCPSQQCFAIASICADARDFALPPEPILLYLFRPLPESGLVRFLANLEASRRQHPRPVLLIYHNPLLDHLLPGKKIHSTHQYSIFTM